MSTSGVYLDVELKLRENSDDNKNVVGTTTEAIVTAAYFHGSIQSSLYNLFGEIGGQTELELVKFDPHQRRGIFKVPEEFYKRTRAAITLIGHYQEIPCYFKVNKTSATVLDL